jgi:hypothetical protein
MQARSPRVKLFAAALAVVLVSGYAGPAVCATVHGHAGREAPAEHCSNGPSHDGGVPDRGSSLVAAAGIPLACPDAAHCGAGIGGPVLRPVSWVLSVPRPDEPTPPVAAGAPESPLGPPAPPPKV